MVKISLPSPIREGQGGGVVNTFACYLSKADAFGRAGSNPVLDVFFSFAEFFLLTPLKEEKPPLSGMFIHDGLRTLKLHYFV